MNYVIVFLVLSLVILFHEWGHFLAARGVRLPIRIFSIGFGPKLWSFTHHHTEYRLSLVPFGGYVLPDIDDEQGFYAIAPWKRIVMAAGGPLASVILTVLGFATINLLTADFSLENLLFKPFYQTATLFGKMLTVLPTVFTKPAQLSGAVGIVMSGGAFIAANYRLALSFMALLSLNLAVLNFLPFPVLDGGKILLYLLEQAHPKLARLQYPLAIAGWILLVGLMVYTTVLDVGKFFYKV
jgi:regulator of sigma E protease